MHRKILEAMDGKYVEIEAVGVNGTIRGILDTSQLEETDTVHIDEEINWTPAAGSTYKHHVVDADRITELSWSKQ